MYSERIVLHNLDGFAAQEGWMPIAHSIAQIQEFNTYVKSLYKEESNSKTTFLTLTKALTQKRWQEIQRWIQNEQVMCALDSSYWETRYAYVCDEKGQSFKFKNRMSQQVFDSVISEFDEAQVSIELLILKARQLGVTTKAALKFIHRLMFIPHTQAVMASVQSDKSELIGRILDTAYNKCPFWLVPRKLPKKMFANGSILSIQSGMQATGIAQGWTPQCVHVSELCDIPNPQKVIEEGLLRATHSSRHLFLVLESTGGGNTGWLADTWRAAKKGYPASSRLCPIFIPWPMATDLYPEADWLRKFPVPGSWVPMEATRKHVIRCESFIRNTSYLAKIAGKNYRMPVEQQWFWEFNYRQACETKTQKIWLAQMPADDYEALTGVHDSVFDPEVIMGIENQIYEIKTNGEKKRVKAAQTYAITGHDVDDAFYPLEDEIDWTKDAIRVVKQSHRGQKYEWEMIPLKPRDELDEKNTMDRLVVYEPPQRGNYYSCGIDTADGLGKEDEDRCVISLANSRFGGDADMQVAEFTSNRVNSAQVVAFAACIGAWYGNDSPDGKGIKFAIEQIRGPGDTCQHQLKMMGFFNHHKPRRYDSKKIKDDAGKKEGWYSNAWSVPMLMTRFVEAVNGGWYQPRSAWLIEELKVLERHITSGKSKMEHRAGQHDDRVRAAAQSYFTAHDMDILTERSQKRYAAPQKKRSLNQGRCSMNSMALADGW